MSLKHNINKIHVDMLDTFDEVSISEKSSLDYGNYFEMIIKESNKTVKAIIRKVDLENNNFNWKYFSNPDSNKSYLVERNSSLDNFLSNVKEIFDKNRFDSEYLKSINS